MNYRTFSSYQRGYAHVRKGTGCEDYALSFSDPAGRYYIGVICDGHSDKNCFRSATGARFGCECAIEVWKNFMDLYLRLPKDSRIPSIYKDRLKRGIKQRWEQKICEDLLKNPIGAEELTGLSDKVRSYYQAGKALNNIYGATFLSVAVCEDFFAAMQVGDGMIMCIDADGIYYYPLPHDPKGDIGSPASMCDNDLFTRDYAFRCQFFSSLPMAVVVTSDGVEDCMDELKFMSLVREVLLKFNNLEQEGQKCLNEVQQKYLDSFLFYWADHGHGVEDDCSMAGFYSLDDAIPEVTLPHEMAESLWQKAINERNSIIQDYERRKNEVIQKIAQQGRIVSQNRRRIVLHNQMRNSRAQNELVDGIEKLNNMKQILATIDNNEKERVLYYERRLDSLKRVMSKSAQPLFEIDSLIQPSKVENVYIIKDDFDEKLIASKEVLKRKKMVAEEATEELQRAKMAYETSMRRRIAREGEDDSERISFEKEKCREAYEEAFAKEDQALNELKEAQCIYEQMLSETIVNGIEKREQQGLNEEISKSIRLQDETANCNFIDIENHNIDDNVRSLSEKVSSAIKLGEQSSLELLNSAKKCTTRGETEELSQQYCLHDQVKETSKTISEQLCSPKNPYFGRESDFQE